MNSEEDTGSIEELIIIDTEEVCFILKGAKDKVGFDGDRPVKLSSFVNIEYSFFMKAYI